MLELKGIYKSYRIDDLSIEVLKNININFRDKEFISILGASGSGKTTLLNIIGGLDSYDKGDLLIDGFSTSKYLDKDWDNYRNNRIGFVFQNYNLIDHLSVYDNIKVSLTLSNMNKDEIDKKIKDVLDKVGLINYINKKPNTLSGGQMQRVAIARALVNNPDIIVADEPTGALDSKTSKEIMKLLGNISKDKLVVMVTHNSELASKYSTRIINIEDGAIISDTNPYKSNHNKDDINITNDTKSNKSMSFVSAFMLSLYNLLTKRKRTIITSIAGSIGIIGIAIVLALSNGVNKYIKDTEVNSVKDYPIIIERKTYNVFGSIVNSDNNIDDVKCKKNRVCVSDDKNSNIIRNNIKDFKNYIDITKKFSKYALDIVSSYDVDLNVYTNDYKKINSDNFKELASNNYIEVVYGRLPEKYNELVINIDDNNSLSKEILSSLNITNKNKDNYTYNEIINYSFKLILNTDYYKKENNLYVDYSNNLDYIKSLIDNGVILNVVGIIKDNESTSSYIGYKDDLTNYLIDKISKTDIYKDQINNRNINLLNNINFNDYDNTYEDLEKSLGIYEINNPSRISIYAKDYKSKEKIIDLINEYNEKQSKEDKIKYSDMIRTMVRSISKVLGIVSSILIAFAAISLVVSSLMISIITYVSVLERTKEIGILRSIGASKKDIRRIFESETMIEGLLSGLVGIITSLFITSIVNVVVYKIVGIKSIAILSFSNIILLIILSISINVLAGLRSSVIASNKKPVDLLRCE